MICNYTCHYQCYIQDDNKIGCSAMSNGNYTICPKKCLHTEHKNARFRIDIKMVKEKTTLKDLEQKYYDSQSNLTKFEQIRNGLIKEFEDIQLKCLNIQEDIKKCVDKTNWFKLKSFFFFWLYWFIDWKWKKWIKGLQELKKLMKLIKNAYESKDNERIQWIQKKIFKGLNKNNEELKGVIKGSNDNCFIF